MPARAMMEAHVSSGETIWNRLQLDATPVCVGSRPAGVLGRGAVRVDGVLGTATQ
jgi:hypothetical protein